MTGTVGKIIQESKIYRLWREIVLLSGESACNRSVALIAAQAIRRYGENFATVWLNLTENGTLLWRESTFYLLGLRLGNTGWVFQSKLAGLLGQPSLGGGLLYATLVIILVMLPLLGTWQSLGSGWGFFLPWGVILMILSLLVLTNRNLAHLEQGNGLLLFWLTITGSALCASGFQADFDTILMMGIVLLMCRFLRIGLTRNQAVAVMKFLTFSSPLWMLIGLRQLWGAETPPGWLGGLQSLVIPVRIYAVFANPNVFALYLLTVFCWAYYLGKAAPRTRVGTWQKVGCRLVFGLALIALYFTYSRIAWIVTILWLIYWYAPEINIKKGVVAGGSILLFGLLLPDFRVRWLGIVLNDTSVWQRPIIWKAVWRAIAANWLWGAGPGAFGSVYPWYGGTALWAAHAHQQYLQIWLENGLFSLIAFLVIVKNTISDFFKGDLALQAVGLSLIGFLIAGFTETWTASPFLGGYFWLMVGLGGALRRGASERQ